jgi:hypothetical protein
MADAAQTSEPELPAHRVNELRTAVRQHFGPAASRSGAARKWSFAPALRWLLAGGATMALAVAGIVFLMADNTVEVGLYRTDPVRGAAVSEAAVPNARLVTFDQDAPFDAWQKSLTWNQRGKVWIDNEHDLLHILRRDSQGQILDQTEPLAPTDSAQQDQIARAVESLEKR